MSTQADMRAHLDQLEQWILEQASEALSQTAKDATQLLRDEWPNVSDGHPYATGRSARRIRRERVDDFTHRITVDADYSGYTDQGFTRKGPRTARSWAARGMQEGYTEDTLEGVRDSFVAHLKEQLDG